MKHNAFTALSLAAALVVAGSAGATGFTVSFEEQGYELNDAHAWNKLTGDESSIIETNVTFRGTASTKSLSLDTGDGELSYTNDYSGVSVLTMDVCFVAADTDPDTTGFDGKTMVYLNETNNTLRAFTGESGWKTLTGSFSADTWYQLKMEFSGTKVVYSVNGTPVGTNELADTFSTIQSVGFKGTGLVDNFVGAAAGIPGATDDGTGEETGNSASYENGVVTGHFDATLAEDDLQFIRVYNGQNFVTLRYSNSQVVTLPAGFGTPTKVVAYYGDQVSAIPDDMTSIAATAVTTAVQNGTTNIVVTLPALESGLYYKLVDATTGATFPNASASMLVAPNEDGNTGATLTVPVSNDPWGVKKFKLVVDDNP